MKILVANQETPRDALLAALAAHWQFLVASFVCIAASSFAACAVFSLVNDPGQLAMLVLASAIWVITAVAIVVTVGYIRQTYRIWVKT